MLGVTVYGGHDRYLMIALISILLCNTQLINPYPVLEIVTPSLLQECV
jgi:hypothetical protein